MKIFSNLDKIEKSKKIDKWICHKLCENQKSLRFEVSSELFLRNIIDPFYDLIVTFDVKGILEDNRRCLARG